VAAALSAHQHHEATTAAIESLEANGAQPVVVGHALVEAYAVLTRLPDQMRLDPATAITVLSGSWSGCPTATASSEDVWRLLQRASESGLSGSRIYDALIAETVCAAGVDLLLTWNVGHFGRWPMGATRVCSPADAERLRLLAIMAREG
jgi:predicted nucleic acid-binding protein